MKRGILKGVGCGKGVMKGSGEKGFLKWIGENIILKGLEGE